MMAESEDLALRAVLKTEVAYACWHRAMQELELLVRLTGGTARTPSTIMAEVESSARAVRLESGYDECRKCRRRVPRPCHDGQTYHEIGPLDNLCQSVFQGY